VPEVQPSHIIQCVTVFALRWRVPWSRRTKMYFAQSYITVSQGKHGGRLPSLLT
jgi:hypothetical protein